MLNKMSTPDVSVMMVLPDSDVTLSAIASFCAFILLIPRRLIRVNEESCPKASQIIKSCLIIGHVADEEIACRFCLCKVSSVVRECHCGVGVLRLSYFHSRERLT